MKQAILWLIVVLSFAGLLALATARADDARTNRLYARAHLVEAQSSARQDTLAALMPYTIIGLATIGGVIAVVALVAGVVCVAAVWSSRLRGATIQPKIIERQMIILIQPGQSRREVYQLLGGNNEKA
jgi:hypothetical protein